MTTQRDYRQMTWTTDCAARATELVRMALDEDLNGQPDWTTVSLVPPDRWGEAKIVARQPGVLAGMPVVELVRTTVDPRIELIDPRADGTRLTRGDVIAILRGPAGSLLIAERTMLNFLGRLSGIATLTRMFVDAIAGTKARLYDTRKTTPGWRLLEKYAVRQGGGHNHRMALNDSVLIKDNHLAFGASTAAGERFTPAQAVAKAREYAQTHRAGESDEHFLIEVEIDRLDQLPGVLAARPDVVLLDNMSNEQLIAAVAERDATAPGVELEASGGVNLRTVRGIAETGVDRISVGALTHSAIVWDAGLDWN